MFSRAIVANGIAGCVTHLYVPIKNEQMTIREKIYRLNKKAHRLFFLYDYTRRVAAIHNNIWNLEERLTVKSTVKKRTGKYYKSCFQNIPMAKRGYVKWRGEMAQFIYDNL